MNLYNEIKRKNILVVGDVMLDTYFTGDVKRISPEAPVPVFRKLSERSVLGGAANVAANLVAAGQKVSIMSVIGEDEKGKIIESLFREKKINTDLLFKTDRPTTEKIRFMASNNQQVMRLDVEDSSCLGDGECRRFLDIICRKIPEFDLIVFSDYMKGLLTYNFTQKIIGTANENGVKVIIDVKDADYSKYSNVFLLKPNTYELQTLTGMPAENDEDIIKASEFLRTSAKAQYVLTTCGARGMILTGGEGVYKVDSAGKEVFDVTGAGDTTIAYLAAGLANGLQIRRAVEISNYAAGLQVAKVGTSAVFLNEVNEFLVNDKRNTANKILTKSEISNFREAHPDKKIVFTNGCFDILHIGHTRYLQKAASLGDILIVGVNSDASVRKLKGRDRPVNCERDRAELLSMLPFVNYIVVFGEDTPYELIEAIRPDVLVKGGDYKADEVVGKDFVEQRGGKLVLVDFVDGKSTTGIIEKLKKEGTDEDGNS